LRADLNPAAPFFMKKPDSIPETDYSYDLMVDKVPYHIRVTPFLFNEEKRFRISVNGDSGHVFVWDPEIVGLHAIDDDASTLPNSLEKAISDRLAKTINLS
jgi:hypothetical protein